MIELRSLNNNRSKVTVIYLLKSEISRMTRSETENITYITMKNNAFPSYDVLETPEEILSMPDIETAGKVIDWEQRRYEIAKQMLPAIYAYDKPQDGEDYLTIQEAANEAVRYADALINELKKGVEK